MNTNSTRVVITGMGIISPLGNDVDNFWDKLIHGISGIGPMTLCDTKVFKSILKDIYWGMFGMS